MSKASEWARRQSDAPAIEFRSPQDDYRVLAEVGRLYGPHEEDDGLAVLGIRDSQGNQIGIRSDNALLLARWIIDTFSEPTP